ncbi:hypothetical protein E3N88_30574 [Mikania micrantha]|uniref:Uncharacterized protein n=1 Tax=Mikania micrantha TaxID=192012 RepID=A0A5N6MM81_9ASTR|nr:hypothetical protein E3N88_30574 [Mikania micrantha]
MALSLKFRVHRINSLHMPSAFFHFLSLTAADFRLSQPSSFVQTYHRLDLKHLKPSQLPLLLNRKGLRPIEAFTTLGQTYLALTAFNKNPIEALIAFKPKFEPIAGFPYDRSNLSNTSPINLLDSFTQSAFTTSQIVRTSHKFVSQPSLITPTPLNHTGSWSASFFLCLPATTATTASGEG